MAEQVLPIEQVTPTSRSPLRRGLMRQRSLSPKLRYVPYGTQSAIGASLHGVPTMQSGASYGITPPYAPTLAEYRQQLSEQVLAATYPLTAQVAQTSQTVQQTSALAGHALEATQ